MEWKCCQAASPLTPISNSRKNIEFDFEIQQNKPNHMIYKLNDEYIAQTWSEKIFFSETVA